MKPIDNAVLSYRRLNLLGLFIAGSSLVYASLELESFLGSTNCMLCTGVRLALLCMTALFLLAFLHNPWKSGQRFYAFLNTVLASLGLAAAGRYVWLESVNASTCNTGLEDHPFATNLLEPAKAIIGSGVECLPQSNTFLSGITIPQLTFGIMVILFVICWRLLTRRPKERNFF